MCHVSCVTCHMSHVPCDLKPNSQIVTTVQPVYCQTVKLSDCQTFRLADCLTVRLPVCQTNWLNLNLKPEFLKVTVSPSCNSAKFSWFYPKFWDLLHTSWKFNEFFSKFFSIFCLFLPSYGHVMNFWPIFLRKIFKNKTVTVQKHPLLECLPQPKLILLLPIF